MLFLHLSTLDDSDKQSQLEELYHCYKTQMLSVAYKYLHNTADAEDAVHDVFCCIAMKHMPTLQKIGEEENIRKYLFKAVKHTALNELDRKRRSDSSINTEYDVQRFSHGSHESFVELLCTKAEYDGVIQTILSMEELYRDVLYCHFVLELSVSKTAKLLNRNAATVKKQLVRGKKVLLNRLEEWKDTGCFNEQK